MIDTDPEFQRMVARIFIRNGLDVPKGIDPCLIIGKMDNAQTVKKAVSRPLVYKGEKKLRSKRSSK